MKSSGVLIPAISALLAFAFSGLWLPTAIAEDEERSSGLIEEIVVTSTKRAEGEIAQDISRAATVVSADVMAMNNMVDLIDVSRMVPGAQFKETSTFPGIQRFWLRQVGVTFSVPNFDPAVGVYQDGVFVAQNVAAILDTFDQESIEILRGPQGTLFGRNTSVGAVLTRSKRPTDEYEMNAEVTYGTYSRTDYSLSVSGPIVEGTLNGKLAIMKRDRDGWVDNIAPGDLPEVGEIDMQHIKSAFVWTPNEGLDVTVLTEFYERGGDGAISVPLGTCDSGDGPGTGCHPLSSVASERPWGELYDDEFPWGSHSDHEIEKFIVEANWDLGHGVLTSVSGAINVDVHSGSQFEGIEAFIITTRLNIDQEQFSQELRYASTFSETFDVTAGLYYFSQDLNYGEVRAQGSRVGSAQPGVSDPNNPFGIRAPTYDELEHESWAVFAEARWILNDRWSVIAGGRFTDETKDVKMCLIYTGCASGNEIPPFVGTSGWSAGGGAVEGWDIIDGESWSAFSPKFVLEYRPDDNQLYYLSGTRGFRSGGFSFRAGASELGAQAADPTFRPAFYDREKVDQIELGMKSDWLDNTLRTNITYYYQWWDGIQRNLQEGPIGNIIQRTANVEDSHTYGLEVEINAILASDMWKDGDNLRLDISAAHAESGYDSDYIVSGNDLGEQQFAAPHQTAYVGLSYSHPVGTKGAEVRYRTSYFWQESYRNEGVPRATDIDVNVPIKLWDASIQFNSSDGKWYARAFGKNLSYHKYYVSPVPFADSFGVGLPASPRTYGLTLGYSY